MRERPNHVVQGAIFVGVCLAIAIIAYFAIGIIRVDKIEAPETAAVDRAIGTERQAVSESDPESEKLPAQALSGDQSQRDRADDETPYVRPQWSRNTLFGKYRFADYPAAPLDRAPVLPQFEGAQRSFATFRTVITAGAREGANFAGRIAVVSAGCGGGCVRYWFVDLATGAVRAHEPAGALDEPSYNELDYHADSALLTEVFQDRPDGSDETACVYNVYRWQGGGLVALASEIQTLAAEQYDCP